MAMWLLCFDILVLFPAILHPVVFLHLDSGDDARVFLWRVFVASQRRLQDISSGTTTENLGP